MEVLPAIDLLGDEAVRLRQGDYGRVTGFGAPAELAARFAAEGARTIHVVDLDGARTGRVRPEVVRAIVEAAGPASVQASGGVRSVAAARALLEAGAARVVVGTAAFGGLLPDFVEALGERLVVALDVRDGVVRATGWTESTGLPVDEAIDLCGGIRDKADLGALDAAGAVGAIVGRALLEGRLALRRCPSHSRNGV